MQPVVPRVSTVFGLARDPILCQNHHPPQSHFSRRFLRFRRILAVTFGFQWKSSITEQHSKCVCGRHGLIKLFLDVGVEVLFLAYRSEYGVVHRSVT